MPTGLVRSRTTSSWLDKGGLLAGRRGRSGAGSVRGRRSRRLASRRRSLAGRPKVSTSGAKTAGLDSVELLVFNGDPRPMHGRGAKAYDLSVVRSVPSPAPLRSLQTDEQSPTASGRPGRRADKGFRTPRAQPVPHQKGSVPTRVPPRRRPGVATRVGRLAVGRSL
jgi:hypothetical protein